MARNLKELREKACRYLKNNPDAGKSKDKALRWDCTWNDQKTATRLQC